MKQEASFEEVFKIELDGWCYGLANYPGEVFPGLVHRVVKELSRSFKAALEHHIAFDILDISMKLSKAAKYLIDEREICFSILAQIPPPSEFDEEAQFALGRVIEQVEQAYGGALERLEKKWKLEKKSLES